MGGALSARCRSVEEPWVELEAAKALSANPYALAARYHREGGRALAEDYDAHGAALGEGANGTVTLAIGRLDGQRYALKRLPKQNRSPEDSKCMQREVEIHLAVGHPNIARLMDAYETPHELALVTECCEGGELFDRLIEQKKFAEPDAAMAARQMLRALSYLHSQKIVHRDLKLENWLFESKDKDAPLKLIDFGFAKVWGPGMPKMHSCCGTPAYISPDVLRGRGYTSQCDLWSLGVIVFALISGYMPCPGDETAMQAEGKVNWKGKAWLHASEDAFNFTSALLAFDPKRRLDAKAALAHPWLAQPAGQEERGLSDEVVLSMQKYAGASRLRRAALQVLTRELLQEESRELNQLFLGLDQTNKGTISMCELADALAELRRKQVDAGLRSGFALCSTPKKAGHHSPSSVTTADTDPQDWSLSSSTSAGTDFEDWSPLGSTASATSMDVSRTEAEELFRVLDTSGRGEAQCSDFIAAALGSQPQLRQEAVQRAFARLDADRSGGIGAEDLRRALGGPFEGVGPDALLASAGALLDAHGELTPSAFAAMLGA